MSKHAPPRRPQPCGSCGFSPCSCPPPESIVAPDSYGMSGKEERKEEREDKKEERKEKTATARQWRIDKINALKEKFYAVALKRKWLVFLIGIGLIAYLVISSGGLSLGGIFDKIKGIF